MTHPAILPTETEDLSWVANEAPRPAQRSVYLTSDEINWLDDLARRHKWDVLRALLAINERRTWDGPGMAVDGAKVRRHLDGLLRRKGAR